MADSCSTAACHGGISKHKYVHDPAGTDQCLACHEQQEGEKVHPGKEGPEFTLAATGENLCLECHESYEGKYEHGPAVSGGCSICHAPHGAEQKALLRRPMQELCLDCHMDLSMGLENATFVHSAILELDCGSCHQPHSSSFPFLLQGETNSICFNCHEDIKEKFDRSLSKHQPLYTENRCANCHLAHFSEKPSLLNMDGITLCMSCHGPDRKNNGSSATPTLNLDLENSEFVHAPIEDDGCISCHDPHGSKYDAILTGPYPTTFYAPYEEKKYGLCFQCHEEELLRKGGETDFRNGSMNLHTVHVVRKDKGRTCSACHNAHVSNGEKMINMEGVVFGDWKIPIRFEGTETGGSCMPGCHRLMVYDRKKPADNSEKKKKKDE